MSDTFHESRACVKIRKQLFLVPLLIKFNGEKSIKLCVSNEVKSAKRNLGEGSLKCAM